MRFMLAGFTAAGAPFATVTARRPDRVTKAITGHAKPGTRSGLNPAAVVFGPPGQDMASFAARPANGQIH